MEEEGTSQLSKTNSHVLLPLIPNLSSLGEVLNPGIPFSIKKAVIPWDPVAVLA